MRHLFKGQDAVRRYFEQWVAHKIQHPEVKMPIILILIGAQGAGKSLLGEILGSMFGSYFAEVAGNQFGTKFNEWAAKKLFALINELLQPISGPTAI